MFDKKYRVQGSIEYLVQGNHCIHIETGKECVISNVDIEKAVFTVSFNENHKILNEWELYSEEALRFQFLEDAKKVSIEELSHLQDRLFYYREKAVVRMVPEHGIEAKKRISQLKVEIKKKASDQGVLLEPNIDRKEQIQELYYSLLQKANLLHIEEVVSKQMIENPKSFEVEKLLSIGLAHLGFMTYHGTILRNPIFTMDEIKEYILYRLAFVRVLFQTPVILYRGAKIEKDYIELRRTFLSWTDQLNVAESYAEFQDLLFNASYVMKRTVKVEELFMTHFETKSMQNSGHSTDFLLIYKDKIVI